MRYQIQHITEFSYSQPVQQSRQLLHLTPRSTDHQSVVRSELRTTPIAAQRDTRTDYFGNHATALQFNQAHRSLHIQTTSVVDVAEKQEILLDLSPSWELVAAQLQQPETESMWDAARFTFPSRWVELDAVFKLSDEIFSPGKPILRGAMDLTSHIYHQFEYRGDVTDVYTPISEIQHNRHGVCQDFAHLAIACLRAKGLAARYVSGYLLTHPAPGKAKLVGADASHAWLSVYCPDFGWVDFDPTNNLRPGNEHIQVAWGRDYGDVSPIKGVIHGGGRQRQKVSVDVSPC